MDYFSNARRYDLRTATNFYVGALWGRLADCGGLPTRLVFAASRYVEQVANRRAGCQPAPRLLLAAFLALYSAPAFPADLAAPGVSNFRQVDEHVYRGGQPSDKGLVNLSKLGIKTVIDLRSTDQRSEAEKKTAEALGMRYINVPMPSLAAPADEVIAKILSLLESDSSAPVFVHCMRGKDRTGTVVACYRIRHDHWQNQKALQEAKANGMSGLEAGMKRYILRYTPSLTATRE